MGTENQKIKTCFIITPIGPDNSEVRRAAEGVIDSLITPVLEEEGYDVAVAHRMYNAGSITKQILSKILTDDLVIANLTGLNPNVMYEVAIRHAARKPIVQLCEKGTKLPFDIVEERTIFYTNDMLGVVERKEDLKSMIKEAVIEEEIDNPVYRATEEVRILQDVKSKDPEKYDVLKRMDELEGRLLSILDTRRGTIDLRKKPKKSHYELMLELLDPEYDVNLLIEELYASFRGLFRLKKSSEYDAILVASIDENIDIIKVIEVVEVGTDYKVDVVEILNI
ncbi:hypothetical protein [Sediminibacillus halophilus]|uniref:Nucleoside 2-deoxyribosyltransferase n=1 Tax=Sediminibacillus halophilus TaxID=482461 RepID=A0A1G9QVE3_9BACI|nr:hypothetical protein [Sediminibacillus halophilus]SDM14992.1 hypothetical protein SAMN05216244_1686 [Sediminibacillus halophilus]